MCAASTILDYMYLDHFFRRLRNEISAFLIAAVGTLVRKKLRVFSRRIVRERRIFKDSNCSIEHDDMFLLPCFVYEIKRES